MLGAGGLARGIAGIPAAVITRQNVVHRVMDRGIPTEAVLREMREADQPVHYLVGTPRAKMRKMEQDGATVAGVTVAEGAGFGGGEVGGRGWREVCAGQERRTAG